MVVLSRRRSPFSGRERFLRLGVQRERRESVRTYLLARLDAGLGTTGTRPRAQGPGDGAPDSAGAAAYPQHQLQALGGDDHHRQERGGDADRCQRQHRQTRPSGVRFGPQQARREEETAQRQIDGDDHRDGDRELATDLSPRRRAALTTCRALQLEQRRQQRRDHEEQPAQTEPRKPSGHQCPFS
jgi:hypothetical protein